MEKEQILKELQNNAETIIKTMLPKALNEGQENKYKNYINALDSTLRLIDRYSWELKWSKFRDENGKQFISIWEQDIDGQIKNNEKFAVDEFFKVDEIGNIKITKTKVYKTKTFDKYLKTSQRMLDLFNEVKENKKSQVIYTDSNMRNIGKTYSLLEILKDNENTVLLTEVTEIYNLKYKNMTKEKSIFHKVSAIRGIDLSKIVLVDESVSKEEFDKMDNLGIVYCGYRNISTL